MFLYKLELNDFTFYLTDKIKSIHVSGISFKKHCRVSFDQKRKHFCPQNNLYVVV